MTVSTELSTFLSYSLSQKSCALAIVRDSERTIKILESEGFTNLQNPSDLKRVGKRYIWITDENAKEVYDLAIQYGTGQVSLYDQEENKTDWINPIYNESALLIVINKKSLLGMEERGLPIRTVTGMAIQIA